MKVLMVCLGNICRSPLAQGILEQIVEEENLDWEVDSAGTSAWHLGEKPDRRSIEIADNYQIDISHQRARQFVREDFDNFDIILAMDASNFNDINSLTEDQSHRSKVRMILNYSFEGQNRAVPDPYYSGGFDHVYQLLLEACKKIVEKHG